MRILFTTTGYSGHLLPLLPLARELTLAGHEVRFAAPRVRGANVEARGLRLEPLADPDGERLSALIAALSGLHPEAAHERVVAEGFAGIAARAMLGDLLALVESWRPQLLVRESFEFAACVAAERFGTPQLRIALGLAGAERVVLDAAAPVVEGLATELGLDGRAAAERMRAAPAISAAPAALDDRDSRTGRVHRFAEGPVPRKRSRRGSRPLVYLSFGSLAGSVGLFPDLYREAIDALAGFPARVLVTLGADPDPAELGRLPGNVVVERWVEQDEVLAEAAAVVCHGGWGSTLGALSHGLPVVAAPLFSGDQWINARRVAELGAGLAIDAASDSGRRMFEPPELATALPQALEAVLADPRYAAAAGGLADAFAALPSPAAAAALVGELAQKHRGVLPDAVALGRS